MDNRYLRDRARRRRRRDMDYRRRRMDRRGRDYAGYDYSEYDSMGTYRADSRNMDSRSDRHSQYGGQYMHPTAYEVGHYIYGPDGRDYDDANEYHKELEEWMHSLKRSDRFGLQKEEVLKKAKDMGVKFQDFDEAEFYTIYLMHISDYPQVANEPHTYLAMAKAWLEDKDAKRRGSEKVCAYLYSVVLGEDE